MKEFTQRYWAYFLIPIMFFLLFFGKEIDTTIHETFFMHELQTAEESAPNILMLGNEQKIILESSGTWSELFPNTAPQNGSELIAVILWWSFCSIFGWLVYPIIRFLFSGLSDCGFPLSKLCSFLLLGYCAWSAGSLGIRITRIFIGVILVAIVFLSFLFFIKNKENIINELIEKRSYFLKVETIALIAFALFLFIRYQNPDLWHLYFGGEKPMDFSFFNAVLKSEIFPPYDPWFAGGQMNYYYLGFVLIGMPVKFLGITPSIAYNLVLPTLFSFVLLGAFSIGWNLAHSGKWIGGLFSALFLSFFGNLGAVRMVWQGWQRLSAVSMPISRMSAINNLQNAISGAVKWIAGERLPYSPGDWYWIPSRAIIPSGGGEITEFPLFTFLYADLHAHLIALPITLLVIAWAINIVKTNFILENNRSIFAKLTFGSLIVGSLRAINAWDQPTFLLFSSLSLFYILVQYRKRQLFEEGFPILQTAAYLVYFLSMSFILYLPFYLTFQQGYSDILLWNGDKVNLSSYTVHFGLFLFILCVYVLNKIIDWMATTPISILYKIKPYRRWIEGFLICFLFIFILLLVNHIQISLLVFPLLLGLAGLFFKKNQFTEERFTLFLAGTGLFITLFVDIATIQGDRMNTTFKFYFQAWTFLSISAGAAVVSILQNMEKWKLTIQKLFYSCLLILIAGCFFTTSTSINNKMRDRMTVDAPYTLDGMRYMDFTTMVDGPPDGELESMNLAQDAQAIRWMQQNIAGSPVIVEAHTQEYRHWGNRFSIYTGLPGIIGWANHERQQRAVMKDDPVGKRITQVEQFYRTDNLDEAITFLQTFDVSYIIVGQLEQIYYPESGLAKFPKYEGILWDLVYSNEKTEIYKVQR